MALTIVRAVTAPRTPGGTKPISTLASASRWTPFTLPVPAAITAMFPAAPGAPGATVTMSSGASAAMP